MSTTKGVGALPLHRFSTLSPGPFTLLTIATIEKNLRQVEREDAKGLLSCGALTRGEDGRGWVVGASTKSGKGRRVRLTQRAATALKDHRKRQLEERMRLARLWQDQGLIFPNEIGSFLNPSNLRNRSFKRIRYAPASGQTYASTTLGTHALRYCSEKAST